MHPKGLFRLSANCVVNLDEQTVIRGFREFRLTDLEFLILECLIDNAGHPVSANVLIQRIWSGRRSGNRENLNVQIGKIRKRVEEDPSHPQHLLSIHGVGYMMWAADNRSILDEHE
ncbi:MAG: winged helix-turn-helix domain-containing protein [Armatimonadota bacterium]